MSDFLKIGRSRQTMAIQNALRKVGTTTIAAGDSTGSVDFSNAVIRTVTMDGASGTSGSAGSVAVPAGSQYAIPIGWSVVAGQSPSNFAFTWQVSGTTLSVGGPNACTDDITFIVF